MLFGQVKSDHVKDYMEKANIFIATSGKKEAWGAVINEAMNSACAIVANEKMGSVPFLIGDNDRGFMYKNYRDFENKVKKLIDNKDLRDRFSKNAYRYITEKWTESIAAENLIKLFKAIIAGENLDIKEGPASKIN